ncbi:MAG TPA: DUF2459 domain-containing protein [Caulobacteraceae bacterium]|jgi:uncharacterized protein (TIGR02117 family)|nr:DUF2459 domain-containing protein [Caulobacteraceae bacterium]
MSHVGRSGSLAVVAFLGILLLTLATAKSGDPALYPARPGQGGTVFLFDNGWHSDIAVPTAAIEAHGGPLAQAARATSPMPWMLIGWGDARFYEASTSALSRIPDGMAALVGGRPTVVHLEGVWGQPDRVWKRGVRPIRLSEAGLAALLARADRSLVRGPGGAPVMSPIHREPGESFFASRERFSLLHLCNHWTAQLLHAAGVPVTPVLDTLPAGLAFDLRLRAGA